MDSMESWGIFERTGSIEDYLNYTACTKEEPDRERYHDHREDMAYGSSTGGTSWNGFVGDASRGN